MKFTFSRCLFDNGIQSKCYRMKPSHFLEYGHPYLENLSEEPKLPKHQKNQFKILMDLNLLKSSSTNTQFEESTPLLSNTPFTHQKTPKNKSFLNYEMSPIFKSSNSTKLRLDCINSKNNMKIESSDDDEFKMKNDFEIPQQQYQFKAVKMKDSANRFLIRELFNILDEHKANRDKYRVMAYEKAIDSIRNYPHKIRNATEARTLNGIGKSIAAKIDEILQKTPPRNHDQHYKLWHNKPEFNGRRRLTY